MIQAKEFEENQPDLVLPFLTPNYFTFPLKKSNLNIRRMVCFRQPIPISTKVPWQFCSKLNKIRLFCALNLYCLTYTATVQAKEFEKISQI